MRHRFKITLRFAVFTLIILPALFAFFSVTFADTQSFGSSGDSYLRSGSPNVNNGSEIVMDLNDARDGVVSFDISVIPSGSVVASATLTLAATGVGSDTAIKNYGAHRILVDWNESTVTWNIPGSTAGTHFTSSSTETVAVSAVGSYSWNVTSDVADFVNGSATNYGWRLIWSSNISGTNKQVDFGTKENSTASNRPVLNVIYTPPVTSHTITASAGAHGLISPSGVVSVNDGDNQSFTIMADANYHIADVLVDSVSQGAIASYDFLNVVADHVIAASFSINTYTLIYTAGANGSIAGTSSQTVDFGSDGTAVTAVPETGYHFVNWSDDSTSNPRTDTNVSANIAVTANFEADQAPPAPAPAPSGGSGGGGASRVIFSGYAYPGSAIEVLRKSIIDELYFQVPSESIKISDDGSFLISYVGLVKTDYLFALRIKDKDGRSGNILAFNIPLSGDLLEVKDILAPPTIGFEKTLIAKNEVMKILGYATPNNMVELEINSLKYKKTKADQSGFWSFDVDAAYLAYGEHSVRARQIAPDEKLSNFSLTRVFKLLKPVVSRADLNGDNIIDIHDWSVFLFRWGNEDSALRLQNDINGDGEVNIFDFSYFLQAIKI